MIIPAAHSLIYCAEGNPTHEAIMRRHGIAVGCRLPNNRLTSRGVGAGHLFFADQDWLNPDRAAFMAQLAHFKPFMTTVRDWDQHTNREEVLSWAEEAAPHVQAIVIIPKIAGTVHLIPHQVGHRPIVLGYPMGALGSTARIDAREYGRRPTHLLGGAPQVQLAMRRSGRLNVVSADCNMMSKMAKRSLFWQWGIADYAVNRYWPQLQECDGRIISFGHPSWQEALERSAASYAAAWHRGEVLSYRRTNQLAFAFAQVPFHYHEAWK
jgi:hypothetical protein